MTPANMFGALPPSDNFSHNFFAKPFIKDKNLAPELFFLIQTEKCIMLVFIDLISVKRLRYPTVDQGPNFDRFVKCGSLSPD